MFGLFPSDPEELLRLGVPRSSYPPKPTAAAPAAIAPVVSTVLRLSSAMDST
ncbi:Uncharacterised protein [Mycobacteroides abscessus subsp. abscessus]|nr:Uncharacterised protein [Mycobacteroides abscessus subsp. abscessus]